VESHNIALAGSFGLKTVSEGMETKEQIEFLIAHRCGDNHFQLSALGRRMHLPAGYGRVLKPPD